eukprot:TRINITY_DN20311_c0_g1_i2.p1 TRINITY_DN20311_c0_g1~~TRINITY_DN20311_c0_g1_i2.p1  ORF type:complete len:542 (-),score=120.98 TRINITY_DN20311_c0_g1_i2:139-1764(-)
MAPGMPTRLDFSRRQLGLVNDIGRELSSSVPRTGSLPYEEVDLSMNNLSSRHMTALLDILRRCPKLRILKLFKNALDDAGAKALAELFHIWPGIEEMHLSHNQFTAAGADALVMAAEESRPDNVSPLWLRLEQNCIADPENEFDKLQQTCSVCQRENERFCTVRYCCNKSKVHLPHFVKQVKQRGYHSDVQQTAFQPPERQPLTYRAPALPKPNMTGSTAAARPSAWKENSPTVVAAARVNESSVCDASNIIEVNKVASPVRDREQKTYLTMEAEKVLPASEKSGDRNRGVVRPEQLVDSEASTELVCTLCNRVMAQPTMTKCSHLFCSSCFQTWVASKVAEHKRSPKAQQAMEGMPCPTCSKTLRRTETAPLSKAPGPAAALLLRRWRNLQVRCIHHPDHFQHCFGKDAELLSEKAGIQCRWVGDREAYEQHQEQCPVARALDSDPKGVAVHNFAEAAKVEPHAEPEPVAAAADELQFVKFCYNNGGDDSKLSLDVNDLVKVFEIAPNGWAAGIKVDPGTKAEIGNAGWFPADYLHHWGV